MVLNVSKLSMRFGGLKAVDAVSLEVQKDEIVGLIGPNGAGKTTFFNCVTGIYRPEEGLINIRPPGKQQENITNRRPYEITRRGIARTFQNIRLFQNMSVLENVMIGRSCRQSSGLADAIFRTRRARDEEKQVVEESYEILGKLRLQRWVNELAKNLPYGAQRRLEIARALATEPFLLLLDEPAAGMNRQETQELVRLIKALRTSEKISIFLIEHDMSLVMNLCERIYVMEYGKLIAMGKPEEIRKNPKVIHAYLGDEDVA